MAIHILLTAASRGIGVASFAPVGGDARARSALPAEVAEAAHSLSLDALALMMGAAIDINGASYVR